MGSQSRRPGRGGVHWVGVDQRGSWTGGLTCATVAGAEADGGVPGEEGTPRSSPGQIGVHRTSRVRDCTCCSCGAWAVVQDALGEGSQMGWRGPRAERVGSAGARRVLG